jgi:hypothetical protein
MIDPDNNLDSQDTILDENHAQGHGEENFGAHDVGNEILDASGYDQTPHVLEHGDEISLSGAYTAGEDEILHTDNAIAMELTGDIEDEYDDFNKNNGSDDELTAMHNIGIYRKTMVKEGTEEDERANLLQGSALADTDIEDNYLNEDDADQADDLFNGANIDEDMLGDDLIDTSYPSDHVLRQKYQ